MRHQTKIHFHKEDDPYSPEGKGSAEGEKAEDVY